MEFQSREKSLQLVGKLIMSSESTPARILLSTFLRSTKRPPKIPKETLLNYVRHQFTNSAARINFESISDAIGDLKHLCANRKRWREMEREEITHKVCVKNKVKKRSLKTFWLIDR